MSTSSAIRVEAMSFSLFTMANFWRLVRQLVFYGSILSVWQLLYKLEISARDGVGNIPALQRRAARVFGASRLQTMRYVTLPGMLPSMAQGLKLGWAFSWRSLMAAELLYSAVGLGHLLQVGRDLNDMPQ